MKSKRLGFTLIELLIVVAIIAILAAIAVPNFLEAQVRSKVSRVKAEHRTIATAIEAYVTDWNRTPRNSFGSAQTIFGVAYPADHWGSPAGPTIGGTLLPNITTPIAYITTFTFPDPFVNNDASIPKDEQLYTYQAQTWMFNSSNAAGNYSGNQLTMTPVDQFMEYYGHWRLASIGPDRDYGNRLNRTGGAYWSPTPYDATNGTTSRGNIWRSQKGTESFRWPL